MGTKLKQPIEIETAFDSYRLVELIGEGGAGRVYAGESSDGTPVAVKVLPQDKANADRRKRFKNETRFLAKTSHANLVQVVDHGVARSAPIIGSFYVMQRFDCSLRDLMKQGINPKQVMTLFSQMLEGIEAAHLKGAVHRDLKPENILCLRKEPSLVIADFGIASFEEEDLYTAVETRHEQRLANFVYAAPEQRERGKPVSAQADIYALGLILNEMFTGQVPTGTGYRQIGDVAKDFAYLDRLVAEMIRQNPGDRPATVALLKGLAHRYGAEVESAQRLDEVNGTVVKAGQVTNPLALEPPVVADVDWENDTLTIFLDRPVDAQWVSALQNDMGNYNFLINAPPRAFHFAGNRARVAASHSEVQSVIDSFKTWLPLATTTLRQRLEREAAQAAEKKRREIETARTQEERRLQVLKSVKV